MEFLERAIGIALAAHEGQVDKAGAPYILHALRVMMRMQGEEAMAAAVLHDVLEDSPYGPDMLLNSHIPEEVVEAVLSVTRRENEAYEQFIRRAAENPTGRRVKIADLEDNMDIRRLDKLGNASQARLKKYLKAWKFLSAPGASSNLSLI